MAIIDKTLALAIAKKLKARIVKKTGPHDIAQIYHKGVLITFFGIRRGSNKSLGHGHLPGALFLTPMRTRLLGQCHITPEEWLAILKEKGKI